MTPPPTSENVVCTSDLPRGRIYLFDENTIKRNIHLDMIELFVFTFNEYNGKEKEQDPQSFRSNAWSLPTAVARFDIISELAVLSKDWNKWVNNLSSKKSRPYITGKQKENVLRESRFKSAPRQNSQTVL